MIVRARNARRRLLAALAPCLGSLFVVAASMGVVAPPTSELREATDQCDREARRVQRAGDDARASAPLDEPGLPERVAEARRLVDSLLPTLVQPIDLHAALYFVAGAEGVVLDEVVLGELEDPGLAVLHDWIGLRDVTLRGSASIEALGAFVRGLCELGFPVAVLDFSLARSQSEAGPGEAGQPVGNTAAGARGGESFAFEIALGALERAPLALRPTDEWTEWGSSDGGGR